jgi:alcohol dehydrogenase class IV
MVWGAGPEETVMSTHTSFLFNIPTPIEFGPGVAANVGERARAMGIRHAMLVTDRALAGGEACARAQAALAQAGLALVGSSTTSA